MLCRDGVGRVVLMDERALQICTQCMPVHGQSGVLVRDKLGSGGVAELGWVRDLCALRGSGLLYRVKMQKRWRTYLLTLLGAPAEMMSAYVEMGVRVSERGLFDVTGTPAIVQRGLYHVLRLCGKQFPRDILPLVREFEVYPMEMMTAIGGVSVDKYQYALPMSVNIISVICVKIRR